MHADAPLESPRRNVLVALLAAALTAPFAARAQATADDTTERARAAFERGVALGRADRWAEALEAFRGSYATAPRPRTCFNVGLAQHHVGRLREAASTLRSCLAAPELASDAALARDTSDLLAEVTRALGILDLLVEPPHAALRVDAEPVEGTGGTRSIALDPGSHRVQLSAEGSAPQEFSVAIAAGQRTIRRVDLRVLSARLVIRTPSPQAAVSIDDDPIGRGVTEWFGPPGEHRVRVELAAHDPWRHAYTLAPGQHLDITVSLTPSNRPLHRNPWLWVGVGAAVAATAAVAVYLLLPGERAVDAGTTGQVVPVGTR